MANDKIVRADVDGWLEHRDDGEREAQQERPSAKVDLRYVARRTGRGVLRSVGAVAEGFFPRLKELRGVLDELADEVGGVRIEEQEIDLDDDVEDDDEDILPPGERLLTGPDMVLLEDRLVVMKKTMELGDDAMPARTWASVVNAPAEYATRLFGEIQRALGNGARWQGTMADCQATLRDVGRVAERLKEGKAIPNSEFQREMRDERRASEKERSPDEVISALLQQARNKWELALQDLKRLANWADMRRVEERARDRSQK